MGGERVELDGLYRFQEPAIVPMALVDIRLSRSERLIPEVRELKFGAKIEKAVDLLGRLKERGYMPEQRQWSIDYFGACLNGPEARRQFLIEGEVFCGGEHLLCPSVVIPRMEFANLDPSNHINSIKQDVEEMMKLMFAEYFLAKDAISFPNRFDLVDLVRRKLHLDGLVRMPEPLLKQSLLLRDYENAVLKEMRRFGREDLIGIFGPGKGEEMARLIKEYSVVCFDLHSISPLKDMFETTFRQAGFSEDEMPEIIALETGKVEEVLGKWREDDCPSTVFVCSGVDFSEREAIPDELAGVVAVSASVYALHEVPLDRKGVVFENMAKASSGSVVLFDGNPTCEAFDRVVLPVGDRINAPITGHDAVVTHLLCLPSDRIGQIAQNAVPELIWKVDVVKSAPSFVFPPQQVAAIGRKPRKRR
ncbi:hypothetical protein KKA02_03100 [Patescibacteria group bacterium]|nr:hypothetical protein [Patescibacteria group bacterium]